MFGISWVLSTSGRKAGPTGKTAVLLAFLVLLLVSCAPPASTGPGPGNRTETVTQADATIQPDSSGTSIPAASAEAQGEEGPERLFPTLPEGFERIEGTQQSAVTGEVPASLLESILDDLSGRLGEDSQEIEVIKAEAILWPDGSLGCPKPGEVYTQEPVSGYWIILEVGTTPYDYHASERGHFFLCERSLP